MSWLKTALTITTMHPDSFYTVVDPGEFYEWQFQGFIPEGKVFTKLLPPSDVFINGKIIATARLPDSELEQSKFGFKTKNDVHTEIMLQAGLIQTPRELLDRKRRYSKEFSDNLEKFKQTVSVRPYYISGGHLFKVVKSGSKLSLMEFGKTETIREKLVAVERVLAVPPKTGRSYEMEDYRRFNNALTFVNNNLPTDSVKIDTLLNLARIESQKESPMEWEECFVKLSSDAKDVKGILDGYNSLGWVRALTHLPGLA